MASIVTPGTVVGTADKNSPGAGTTEQNGNLIALLTGTVVENDGVISIDSYNEMLRLEAGDMVIGEVVKLNEKAGEIKVLSVEGKANRSIMADQEYAQFHVTRICDRFLHNTADGLRRRDIVRAKVSEAGNVVRIDMREDANCGVLWALCPSCGDTFVAEQNGDWNVSCRTCGEESFRALADDFGGEAGKSALNGAGKRWSGAAEAQFAKEALDVQLSLQKMFEKMAVSALTSDSKALAAVAVENVGKKQPLVADYSSAVFLVMLKMMSYALNSKNMVK